MEMERGKCVIASATSILKVREPRTINGLKDGLILVRVSPIKAENDDDESKGTISAIVRTV